MDRETASRKSAVRPLPAVFVVAAALLVLLFGCQSKTPQQGQAQAGALKVGLVFDVGGLGDKSFNDAAYAGLDSAKKTLGITEEHLEPGEGGDRESALRQFAAGDKDLIIGVGFLFSDDIKTVARDFPNKKFACVDMNVAPGESLAANVVALKFKEEEGSYLVGALSGLLTKTHVVGFLGGMQIPLIKKFEEGYKAGVAKTSPQTRVLVKYAGTTGQAFKDPPKGKELGLAMYEQGADIVFHASGSTGLGLFEAAKQKDALAIGVDSDQNDAMPGHVLTSMVKRVDVAVFDTIRETKDGQFPGGQARVYGLRENGVGYVYDARNASLIPAAAKAVVDSLGREIMAGRISVPSE